MAQSSIPDCFIISAMCSNTYHESEIKSISFRSTYIYSDGCIYNYYNSLNAKAINVHPRDSTIDL